MSANPGGSEGNNPVSRSSQNKAQLLEAMMRNVPKLKELNYTQWKNIMTNSIKKAKLWEYVDGSIEEPSEHDASSLATYYDEATAVRHAILGSLEPAAQRYIEEALDPREAWLALEKKYLTAEAETDSKLASIEKQLIDLRLEEGGDMVDHIADFCRMRSQLSGTRLAIDDQACISMLYRSLPPTYRQLVLTPEGTEMKEFSTLCARLTYLSQNPEPEVPVDVTLPTPAEDFTAWGVPEDIKAFGLTGDKNPLLEERAAVTCRDCLLRDHKAGMPECPQNEWRKELWGTKTNTAPGTGDSGEGFHSERPPVNSKRLSYEFSDPVKVVLDFDELGLKPYLRNHLRCYPTIQQCAILPVIDGRNVLIQAPPNNGKTTVLAVSVLQVIDTAFLHAQALVFMSTVEAVTAFKTILNSLQASNTSAQCFSEGTGGTTLVGINNHHIFVGTPDYLLGLARRNIINMRKLKIVVLDNIDKLIELGTEDQILEVYRHVPPLAQVIASSTVVSLSISSMVTKLLADPLQISVKRNEGITTGTHFYVKVPVQQKPAVLYASFSVLGVDGFALICNDLTQITQINWGGTYGFYYLQESMQSSQCSRVTQNFISKLSGISSNKAQNGIYYNPYDSVSKVILVTTDTVLSTMGQSKISAPLINYDVPSNVEDYVKRLDCWRLTDPAQSQMIITFVTANTDEINIIQDLERYYGVHVAEVLWDAESKKLY
ncbi:putative DEAD-box RNA helicase [Rhizoctonia solani 123E]|uniref:Putative DEAD-box RNA helicase n=1 Tax=Rhizoctonia solani 123E TaxID=1423351 RepID=A0A074RG98_9AGAM|nr:putative DEAD-box RNA helicase [Rhizoctonia solani 123E]